MATKKRTRAMDDPSGDEMDDVTEVPSTVTYEVAPGHTVQQGHRQLGPGSPISPPHAEVSRLLGRKVIREKKAAPEEASPDTESSEI